MRITYNRGEKSFEIVGAVPLRKALEAMGGEVLKEADVHLRLAKVAKAERDAKAQARAEVAAEAALQRIDVYTRAMKNLPPNRRSRLERLDNHVSPKLEGGA